MTNKEKELFEKAISASILAGKAILEVYEEDFTVELKTDNSPLTKADKRSNEVITNKLQLTGLPVLSEEGKEIPYDERKNWEYYWLVDPLDGTKEFIKRNGEFTVNIALMHLNAPVFGIIYVPVQRELYFGGKENASYFLGDVVEPLGSYDEYVKAAHKLPLPMERKSYMMIGSRSHMSEETREYFEKVRMEKGDVNVLSRCSSLKLCMIATGHADEYPRFAPTMEWDTAAGQAIIEGAGKQVIHYKSGNIMYYNKESLVNGWFVAKSK